MTAKLTTATIPAKFGDSKWSPTPTASRDYYSRLSGPVTGNVYACSAGSAGGLSRFKPRSVGIGPCLCRAFLLMVWGFHG